MRFVSLTVENLGVFRGRYDFNLTPHLPADDHRNAIVFTGHNGAGKTMLFTALQLALHGPLALGDRVTRQEYSDYLFHRLHRFYSDGRTLVSDHGSAAVKIEYSRSGKLSLVEIARKWARRGNTVHETVDVALDGATPDISRDDVQSWINDFFAPSFLPVCFLDAEQLSVMSDPQEYEKLLARNLRRLLGLDLVERLEGDIAQYIRTESLGGDTDSVDAQLKHLDFERARLTSNLDSLREQDAAISAEINDCVGAMLSTERELASEGGAFAARREQTQKDAERLKGKIGELQRQLADLAAELLPFALAPTLVSRTGIRLRGEGILRQRRAATDAVSEWAEAVLARVVDPAFFAGLRISEAVRVCIRERLSDTLLPESPDDAPTPDKFLHDVGDSTRETMIGWTDDVTGRCVAVAETIARELRELKRDLRIAESELASAPAEEVLRPFHGRIAELQHSIAVKERARVALQVEMGAIDYRLVENSRAADKLRNDLDQLTKNVARLELARKSRLALRAYHDAALRTGLQQFEREFVEEFNLLCRKDDLLNAVLVDPDTFKIRFEAAAGHALRLANFSAGERQLVALSSLWALRIIAKRSLPLAIDTPLGRLDAIHREGVLHDFLPIVADQVLLFATDAEVDLTVDDAFAGTVARSYHLRFDAGRQATDVTVQERTQDAKARRNSRRA